MRGEAIAVMVSGVRRELVMSNSDGEVRAVRAGDTLTLSDGDEFVVEGVDGQMWLSGFWVRYNGRPVAGWRNPGKVTPGQLSGFPGVSWTGGDGRPAW